MLHTHHISNLWGACCLNPALEASILLATSQCPMHSIRFPRPFPFLRIYFSLIALFSFPLRFPYFFDSDSYGYGVLTSNKNELAACAFKTGRWC